MAPELVAAPPAAHEDPQLLQTIEMFEVITQSQPNDYQSLEILKEAYSKLGRQQEFVSTSKRIAQVYVSMGQLSSAILEYESILQRFPDDRDVRKALEEIEGQANNFAASPPAFDTEMLTQSTVEPKGKKNSKPVASDFDDGRAAMQKLFVDSKEITQADFDLCWQRPNLQETPDKVLEPFLQLLADRAIMPVEKSLKLLTTSTGLCYLPIEKYDFDLELVRSFPREICQRWCILPFDCMSKSVLVATCNPFNKQAAVDLEGSTKSRLLWYLAPPADLVKALTKVFR